MKRIFNILVLLYVIAISNVFGNYVIINQLMYDSPWNEKVTVRPYSHGEFIELYNAGLSDANLGGWTMTGDGVTETITFPSNLVIPSEGYLIIAYRYVQSPEFLLSDLFVLPANSNYQIYYQNKIILSNSGETITLKNASGMLVDELYYDGTSHKTKPNRLHAENADSIAGSACKSLHRTDVAFDEYGYVDTARSQWSTDLVSFASHILPQPVYFEDYLTNDQPLPTDKNYIISVTPLDATERVSYSGGMLSVGSNVRTYTSICYYDGLGRPYQKMSLGESPAGNDHVSLTQYAGVDRVTHQWLPLPIKTDGQPLSSEGFIAQATTYYSDNRPYQETRYEESALNRVLEIVSTGTDWANHPIVKTYGINTYSDNVKLFTVDTTDTFSVRYTGQYYSNSLLYKHSIADEDGKAITTYTDKLGNIVLQRQADNDTYYVYNYKGQLCCVLPPLAAAQITAGGHTEADDVLRKYAYIYKYDDRGNQIYKRLPGCEPILMIYDCTNSLAMSQDGNQRAKGGYWTIYEYDEMNRLIYTAEIKSDSINYERYLQNFRNGRMLESFSISGHSRPMANTGYSHNNFHSVETSLLTVNYYDTYDFLLLANSATQSHLEFTPFDGNKTFANSIGLLTGTRTYLLNGDGDYIETVYYYDEYAREIQRRTANHLGGYDVLSTKYDFTSNVTDTWSEQSTSIGFVTNEYYHYTYDHAGRALETFYTYNDDAPILLQSYQYDELGRVRSRKLHNDLDSLSFAYDIHNQVTQLKSSGYTQNYYYTQKYRGGGNMSEGYYNGNISSTKWTYGNKMNGYIYSYDNMNRLSSSTSLSNQVVEKENSYLERFQYDAHGNITELTRWDNTNVINDLSFTYNGNQITRINDDSSATSHYDTKKYHDNNSFLQDFSYDSNGNMIYDQDRGIVAIRYNLLNLPDTVQLANGNQIVHRYDAAGNRLMTSYYTSKSLVTVPLGNTIKHTNISTNYHKTEDIFQNNIVYCTNNTNYGIKFVHNPEGYIRYNNMNEHYHFYYIKDHLGNVRETYKIPNAGTKECVQRMQYYPSGLPWVESDGTSEQPYKYNGKEFVEMHGLDEYDYGFRFYYPSIGRFTTLDPLGEYTPTQSPYVYANNNWSNEIDFMGLMGHRTNFTVLDSEGNTVYHEDNGDYGVYQLKEGENFDKDKTDRNTLTQVGWEIPGWKKYTTGEPCYYIGMHTDIFSFNEYLMYGNSRSSKTINTTIASLWHYFRGNGVAAQNGLWALSCFINTDTFLAILLKAYVLRHSSAKGSVNMEFEPTQFHIGNTSYSYYTTDNSFIIGYAINDGFWDANFIFEFLGKFIDKPEWKPDGKGPNLELPNGTPYSYVPSYIILPL